MEETTALFFSECAYIIVDYVIIYHVIQHDISHDPQQGGLLDLPSVVLDHVISYLTDPHDLLNFGLTHPLVVYDAVLNLMSWFLGYCRR